MVRKMIDKGVLAKVIIMTIIVFGIYVAIDISSTVKSGDERLFPGILGDAILRSNETGKDVVTNITLYDNFRGNIIQGYKANYSGSNGTMIIFIAQMSDNISANRSFKNMITRIGYNESVRPNQSFGNNTTIIKLPVDNPEVFVIQKNKNATWHYTFTKSDKVYWIGFSDPDIEYQARMLIEVYRDVDEKKDDLDI